MVPAKVYKGVFEIYSIYSYELNNNSNTWNILYYPSNLNLLANPDFKINQGGVLGEFSETGKYFVDRWKLDSGTVTINPDATLTLNGTISQILEYSVGDNVTASVSAGISSYDDSTKTFTITGNGVTISWAKLEYENSVVTAASFVVEIDKAGEASFTMSYNHPMYDKIYKLRTMIVIKNDDNIVWFGRVYGIKRDFFNNKQVICEGALTFLNDICLMPFRYYEEEEGSQTLGGTKTYHIKPVNQLEHLTCILRLYNARCSEKRRVKVIPGNELLASNANINGTDSYNSVLKEIQDIIIENNDYSILTKYELNDDGWVVPIFLIDRLPFSHSGQTIEFGKNLINFEEYLSADEFYSSIIPVGSGNISIFNDNNADDLDSKVPITDRIYYLTAVSEDRLSCGVIDKVINFDNIDDRADLIDVGEKVLKLSEGLTESTFTINAVDLHLLDINIDEIVAGSSLKIISNPHKINSDFICIKTEIDMLNPDRNKYTFCGSEIKTSSEKLTRKVQNEFQKKNKELDKKLTLNQNYGMINIDHNNVSLIFKMFKEK